MQAILIKQERKISLYHAYQQDLRDRAKAYDDLRKARASHEADNEQVITQIKAEKIAAAKQKQAEIEAKRKQAAEKAKDKAKKDSKQDDLSEQNDQSDQNKADKTNKDHKPQNSTAKPSKSKQKDEPKDHYIDPDKENKSSQDNESD